MIYPILSTLRAAANKDTYVPSALVLDALHEIEQVVREVARHAVHGTPTIAALHARQLARQLQPMPRRG